MTMGRSLEATVIENVKSLCNARFPLLAMKLANTTYPHGKILFFLFEKGRDHPQWVVKLPREPIHNHVVEKEFHVLKGLWGSLSPELRSTVPEPLACLRVHGHSALVETALTGKSIAVSLRQNLSREPFRTTQRHVERVLRWLLWIHQETSITTAFDDELEYNYLRKPIGEFVRWHKPKDSVCRFLNRLWQHGAQLKGEAFPLVHRHGDLSLGNILMTRTRLGVVDWDYGELRSLPLLDLLYFLIGYGYYLSSEGFRKRYYEKGVRLFFCDHSNYSELSREVILTYLNSMCLSRQWIEVLFPLMLVYAALNGVRAYGFPVPGDLVYRDLLIWYVERGITLVRRFIKSLRDTS